ncbi:sigma-54-dependent Fis family transcriptional regulator [Siculibacillus lacustris]|uniref:DNA-binding transcriptional regulator NtrC n=1 Tax=Siculibacillus lacustris TaxID=1549641 RepID=A0A4Q9VX28_9HYPH|nr:sigma-54 dependent transcriptional regulator [Siculibacillus lacustris]TBW40803.1 sigma-54-dependent Fis family transcriptional regulator [Siculibacillus lacustris]
MAERILVVDDDPIQRRLLEEAVRRFGHLPIVVSGGAEALRVMAGPDGRTVALVVLDLVMPDLDGMAVLLKLRESGSAVPVIVQTSQGGIDTIVSAMRAGAFDFVVKPVSPERLQVSIQNALKLATLEGEVVRARRTATGTLTFDDLASASPAMERVIRLGRRAAASNIPILIEGESGVGKELIARAIQGSSDRRARPFVTVNCGAIPEHLVESILFGHEKGAFTGAVDRHVGKFQEAHGGTLFLDEVGELAPDIQVKLLRAIQEGEVDPVGGRRPVKVDFRLISATNRSMLDMTKEGRFREDLYYRLNVFPIFVPPLRERKEDLPDLVKTFVARFAAEQGRRRVIGVDREAMALLEAYDWPGNVRQLENAVFRAVVLADGEVLGPDEFPQVAAQVGTVAVLDRHRPLVTGEAARPTPRLGDGEAGRADPLAPRGGDAMTGWSPSPSGLTMGSGPTPFGFLRSLDGDGHVRDLAAIEEEMIRIAIDHYGGRMTEVARRLGIGRSTLYRKLKEYGLEEASDIVAAE